MTQDNELLDKVTARIVELVPGLLPDIENLKEGDSFVSITEPRKDCSKIYVINGAPISIFTASYKTEPHYRVRYVDQNCKEAASIYRRISFIKKDIPIPNTIRLADVMRAIEKVGKYKLIVNQFGHFGIYGASGIIDGRATWDLKQNDLNLQPKRFINLLASVLGVE